MFYKGKYKPRFPEKYKGDPTEIIYRSYWEYRVMKWLDENSGVIEWSSEGVIVPYRCKTDNKVHRYFVDFKFSTAIKHPEHDTKLVFTDFTKTTYLVELKPKSQTKPPIKKSRKTSKYIKEVYTYVKNLSKWEAAKEYASNRGWKFVIWTEDQLKQLGIDVKNKG